MPEPFTLDDVDIDGTTRECNKEVGEVRARLDMLVDEFMLPGSVDKALRWTELISVPLLAFFAVLVIGSEYGWGTLRSVLTKGTGRRRFLASKFAVILIAMAVAWLVVLLTVIAVSVIVTPFVSGVDHGTIGGAIAGTPLAPGSRGCPTSLWLRSSPSSSAPMPVGCCPRPGFRFCTSSSSSSPSAGCSSCSTTLFRWFGSLVEYDLGWNTAAWMFGENEPIPGFALAGAIGTADYPSDTHAFLVQLVFFVGLTALEFWLQRRDVAGSSG